MESCVQPHSSQCMTHTDIHTHGVYGNQYVDQRSPALQPCHSFSALYANTARARVRDRHPIVGVDYRCFYKRLQLDRKEGVSSDVWTRWGPPPPFFSVNV